MFPRSIRPRLGLLITALLEDDWNKTGYLRPTAQAAVQQYIDALAPFADVVCPGLVETEEQAAAADLAFKAERVDAIVFAELAYTQSMITLRGLVNAQVPIIVWNTQMLPAWPADADWDIVMINSGLAGLPETTHALNRLGKPFYMVTGHLRDEIRLARIQQLATAAAIKARLAWARIGMIGHPYQHMADLMVDSFAVRSALGPTVVHVEPEEFGAAVEGVSDEAAAALVAHAQTQWRADELDADIFARSARIALGLEKAVNARELDALAIFDQALLADPRVGLVPSWGNSRLIAAGIPVTAEADVAVATAMLILQALTGDATFVENYGFDFERNAVYIAHDSMGNPNMAAPDPQVALRPSIYYQGRYGRGAALEFAYRPGPCTFLALVPISGGRWKFIVGEGEALPVRPRPTVAPQMLWQPDGGSVEDFYDRWCAAGAGHHSALAYGRLSQPLEALAGMLGVEFERVR